MKWRDVAVYRCGGMQQDVDADGGGGIRMRQDVGAADADAAGCG